MKRLRVLPLSAALLCAVCAGPVESAAPAAKAPLPTVLLYPASAGDIAALVDLRTRLRLDGRVSVLTYDPESAAIQRAAGDTHHPEWLGNAPASDNGRMTLARALGASFYAVVSPGRLADTTHVELVETAPAARTFGWTGTNREFGVHALESQVADSLAHPINSGRDNSAPLPAPLPSAPAPVPGIIADTPIPEPGSAPTTAAPVPIAAAPVLPPAVAALPPAAPAPVTVADTPPLDLTPRPVPLPTLAPPSLPVQVAQALPVTPPSLPAPMQTPIPPAAMPPPVAAVSPPALAEGPLPQRVASVPISPIADAVPEPRLTPEPPLAPTAPKPIAPKPTPIAIAAVPPKIVPKPVQVARLPPPSLPTLPPPVISPPTPAPIVTVKKRPANAEDITAIEPLLAKGDSALDGGDAVSAISYYREAINGAPLAVGPRLKLAGAYQKDGLSDRALDEARRALQIAPDSGQVQQFLSSLDQQTGTTAGMLVRSRAALEGHTADPAAHAALADALWNSGDLAGAEAEYKAAAALSPGGKPAADTQLAQLYAAEARYDDCLALLRTGGPSTYAVAIKIVKSRAETLGSTLAASRETFSAGKSTREQFYDDAKKLSAEAQALAGFVAAVAPPPEYRLSHLHRTLSTNLLAQEAATLVTYIETSDSRRDDRISRLERDAATEMLTAQATEERLGLWTLHSRPPPP